MAGAFSSAFSSAFDVGAAATNVLTIASQPSVGVSTVALGTITVQSDDSAFTGNVTLAIATGSGSLSGTLVVAAVAGTATFTNVIITGTGAHTLTASASGHTSATTTTITVAAIALAVDGQPVIAYDADVMSGISVSSNVPTSTATVTVAKQSGSGSLSGTTSKAMVGGQVLFSDLVITGTGAHVLRFTATGHTLVDSATITVNSGDPPVSTGNDRRRRRTIGMISLWRVR